MTTTTTNIITMMTTEAERAEWREALGWVEERVRAQALTPAQPQQVYEAALEIVGRIDEDLRRGVRHYRTRGGVLLVTLDQVVQAILDNDLATEETELWQQN